MGELIRCTWVPTALFVAVLVGFGIWYGSLEGVWMLIAAILLVFPPVWWLLVARRQVPGLGRGAAAGALAAGIVFLAPVLQLVVAIAAHGPGQGEGELTTFAGILVCAALMVVAVPTGAAVGLVAAFLQRRFAPNPGEADPAVSAREP